MNRTIITVERKELTDRSPVFDVVVGNVRFECIHEKSAIALAEGFQELIRRHTNEFQSRIEFNY